MKFFLFLRFNHYVFLWGRASSSLDYETKILIRIELLNYRSKSTLSNTSFIYFFYLFDEYLSPAIYERGFCTSFFFFKSIKYFCCSCFFVVCRLTRTHIFSFSFIFEHSHRGGFLLIAFRLEQPRLASISFLIFFRFLFFLCLYFILFVFYLIGLSLFHFFSITFINFLC